MEECSIIYSSTYIHICTRFHRDLSPGCGKESLRTISTHILSPATLQHHWTQPALRHPSGTVRGCLSVFANELLQKLSHWQRRIKDILLTRISNIRKKVGRQRKTVIKGRYSERCWYKKARYLVTIMWWATITNVPHQTVSFSSVQFSQQFHTCCSFHHLNPPHIQCRSLRLLPTPVNHHGTSHEASFYYSKCRFTKSWHHHFLSQGDTISQSQSSHSNHLPVFLHMGRNPGTFPWCMCPVLVCISTIDRL